MNTIKRFAFVPLLVLLCLSLGWAVSRNDPFWGTVIAVAVFAPSLVLWDQWRQRR